MPLMVGDSASATKVKIGPLFNPPFNTRGSLIILIYLLSSAELLFRTIPSSLVKVGASSFEHETSRAVTANKTKISFFI